MSRVTTYLNFPGNTEEAVLFYKSVFKPRVETDRLFAALGKGGKVEQALQEMFCRAYWGFCLTDRFGIKWMFNCAAK